jgi:hypothetical protein
VIHGTPGQVAVVARYRNVIGNQRREIKASKRSFAFVFQFWQFSRR